MIILLTEPSLYPWFQLYKFCKNVIKRVIGKKILPYSGHYAVMRSIITGLKQANVSFEYNPAFIGRVDHVHVFGNVSALKMAIFFKRIGFIKYLSAGPNVVISSAEKNGILASKYIDKVIVPSDWVKEAYLIDNSKLSREKMAVWPAGVDLDYWKINKVKNANAINFLFYVKRPERDLLKSCEKIALEHDINITTIVHGKYKLDDFKNALTEADCVVYFVEQESEGIALLEIWATDTPTFVWNPGVWHYHNKNYKCSSAPYLTPRTGHFFREEVEFKTLITNFIENRNDFAPQKYIIENFLDVITAKDFLDKVDYTS